MSEYHVEPLTSDIFSDLSPLMRDAFGDEVNADFFDWKYRRNPAGNAIGKIARYDRTGEIAAFYGMIPEIYQFGSEKRRIYQSCDTMTHSKHRRKGLFKKLALGTYEEAFRTDPDFFAFGFGGPTSTPGFLKMGWRTLFDIPNYFQPYPLTLLKIRQGDHRKVSSTTHLDDPLLSLLTRASPISGPGVARTEAFLRWRLSNPSRTYHYLVDGEDAYAIFLKSPGFLFLIDFWESTPGSGRNVWDALRREALSPRLKGILSVVAERSELAARIRSYAFLRNPFKRGPGAGTTPFIILGTAPLESEKQYWQITPLDHDSY